MGFAEDKFLDYVRNNLPLLHNINVEELLMHLTGCLTLTTEEKLRVFVRNQGNRSTVMDFYLALSRSDDWVEHFIRALRSCGHNELANSAGVFPRSLPPTLSNRQPTLESPQRSSSPPGQIPAASQPGPSSKPSPRDKQIQPVQAMIGGLPSQQNQEFRSLPSFTHNPLPPPGTSEPIQSEPIHSDPRHSDPIHPEPIHSAPIHPEPIHSAPIHPEPIHSAPIHREPIHSAPIHPEPIHPNRRTLEDDTFKNPVPETTPYQRAPTEGEVEALQKDESSISEHPLPSDSLSPSLKSPQSEVSIPPSSENVSPAKVPETRTTPSHSPPTSSERAADNGNGQPVDNKTEKLPERDPAYMTVNSGHGGHGRNVQQREQSALHKAAHRPVQPVLASNVRSVREKGGVQRNGRSAYQAVADVPDSRPANRETTEEEPSREVPANQQVPSGSSCRPLDNNHDEEYFSKPGALNSTSGFAGAPWDGGVSSVLSCIPELQLSDCTEGSGSSNVGDRSSTSSTHNNAPPASTPNTRSMQVEDRKSPEENDFMFDPVRSRRLDHSSNQPEENSFGRVSHYRLQFNEEPEGDLMEGNDDALRNRPKKVPSSSAPNDENTQKKTSENTEGRDRERTLLLTITAASVCLSLYLLWKSRQN